MNEVSESLAWASLFPTDSISGDVTRSATPKTGILPYQAIIAMTRTGEIKAVESIVPGQIQPASLDLRLGRMAYRVRASFLPGPKSTVVDRIQQLEGYPIDLSEGAVLERGCVYVVQLMESLKLPNAVVGLANPKSSTGRLDVFTRLITDFSSAFDQIERGYEGPLYVEVAPRTFSVVVRQGTRLNQVRFQRGDAMVAPSELRRLYEQGQLVRTPGVMPQPELAKHAKLVPVTIDLQGSGPDSLIGYRAKKHTDRIDLEKVAHYDPHDFWEPIRFHREAGITLNPDDFYILVTCEEVGVPPNYAAEMVPYYTRSGEYRVHYAGFFDPGFGWRDAAGGSRAVLEVRSHEVPFMLEHRQTVGWLSYQRMLVRPDRIYGSSIKSNYQDQGLALAKQFQSAVV